jgi:Na+-driven multidrug efflux pump
LVFGNLGFPRLEVDGAAWAAVIASAAGALMMFLWALRRQDRLHFRVFRLSNIDAAVAKVVARLSFFSGVATLVVMTGFALFYGIVGQLDKREGLAGVNTAATQAIINVTMLIFMTCIAFGTATSTLVSQSIGAKKPDLAARYGWQSVLAIVPVMGLIGLLLSSFPEPALRFFMHEDPLKDELYKAQVIAVAAHSLRFCGLIAPLAAGALVLTQALYGAGKSRFVMVAEGVLHFTCLVPLAYLLAVTFELGEIGCWYSTACYAGLLFLATGIKFYAGGWKKIVL